MRRKAAGVSTTLATRIAALVGDLDDRGLPAGTLVCFVTECGRTPRLNESRGRDH